MAAVSRGVGRQLDGEHDDTGAADLGDPDPGAGLDGLPVEALGAPLLAFEADHAEVGVVQAMGLSKVPWAPMRWLAPIPSVG
jgi:hypothetical protein